QLWRGFSGRFSYTFSHTLDNVSNGGVDPYSFNDSLLNQTSPFTPAALNYSNSDYDVRHSLNASYVWDLPVKFGNRALNAVVGGLCREPCSTGPACPSASWMATPLATCKVPARTCRASPCSASHLRQCLSPAERLAWTRHAFPSQILRVGRRLPPSAPFLATRSAGADISTPTWACRR